MELRKVNAIIRSNILEDVEKRLHEIGVKGITVTQVKGYGEEKAFLAKGFAAWIIWKAFKLAMLSRYKTRLQIIADWLITLLFERDTSKLT